MYAWLHDGNVPIVDPAAAAALGTAIRRSDESIPPSSRGIPIDAERRRRRRSDAPPPEEGLERLRAVQAEHPFWHNRLFRACSAGALTREDFQIVFSQYYLYSQNFTRYLAGLMASCENDLFRARLAENIWEEGGQQAPEQRHAEIFRRFLQAGLGVDVGDIDFLEATRFFVREYLDFCVRSHPAAGAAFLSLGTEGIVPRMYAVLLDGLLKAGVAESHLGFFRMHMECDDEHAATLEELMMSYASMPDWASTCHQALDYALSLRARFFDQLYEAVQARRLQRVVANIQRGESLAPEEPDPAAIVHRPGMPGTALYGNVNERLGIAFSVERIPFASDVFDTRVLRVAPRRNNERHKHPHESIFYVMKGTGRVTVNQTAVDVGPGDVVFIPRWAMHQSHNTGDEELVVLALTDFGLTDRAFVGDHLRTTRLKGTQAPR
jgi:pyrroloquinoline quinone (PQQ) biosynthesis protein C/mannose-6-phosphate isomerase-like protein (cupin superfamily)